MNESLLEFLYLALLICWFVVRRPYQRNYLGRSRLVVKDQRIQQLLLGLVMIGFILLPLVAVLTPLLESYRIGIAIWIRLTGAGIYGLGLLLLLWIHHTLGINWSPTLEIQHNHSLITTGPYRYIRHPMYTVFYLLFLGQGILIANTLVFIFGLTSWTVLCLFRIQAEEQMMVNQFGAAYEEYKQKNRKIHTKA